MRRRPVPAVPLFRSERLRRAMAIQELSYVQIAKELNKHARTVRQVVEGQDSKVSTVIKVASRLGVPVAELFSVD